MADTFTPYWGLTLPEVSASRDTWGTKLNADLAALDTLLQALQPIGAMTDFAGWTAPTGWLLCDGSIYPAASYPRLFAVIGNLYGGDGVSNFAVPDARARVTVGTGSTTGSYGYTSTFGLGWRQGDYATPIALANLPSTSISSDPAGDHSHPGSLSDVTGAHQHAGNTDTNGQHSHGYGAVLLHNGDQQIAGGFDSGFGFQQTDVQGAHSHNILTDYRGDHQHALAITGSGSHVHTFNLGGGNVPLPVVPASIATTKIICCGPPSMQSLSNGAAPAGAAMASPLRGLN